MQGRVLQLTGLTSKLQVQRASLSGQAPLACLCQQREALRDATADRRMSCGSLDVGLDAGLLIAAQR